MLRNIQASLRQIKGFVLPEKIHNIWVHYFTTPTPKSLGNVPKNSPLNGHYSNFSFADVNMKILLTESSAIEANPAESLPVMLHFDQPISPHYFKFCITIESLKLDQQVFTKVVQEAGPHLIRALLAFSYQLKRNLQDVLARKENVFFPSRFFSEFRYIVKILMSTSGKIFTDFLFLLIPIIELTLTVDDQSSLIYQLSTDIAVALIPFFGTLKIQREELKPMVCFVSKVFITCTTQDEAFVSFCNAICTNKELFPYLFSEEAYKDFICAVGIALDRICSKKSSKTLFENGISYIHAVVKTVYRQKKQFDIVPHILGFLEWTMAMTNISKFENLDLPSKKLIEEPNKRYTFIFTALNLFDDSSIDEDTVNVTKKIQATFIQAHSELAKICNLLTQLCNRDDNILESVVREFPKKGVTFVYFAMASIYFCPPEKVAAVMQKMCAWKTFYSREIINEITLLEKTNTTSLPNNNNDNNNNDKNDNNNHNNDKNINNDENINNDNINNGRNINNNINYDNNSIKYLINLKNMLLVFLINSQIKDVPAVLCRIIDIDHPVISFKIVQLFNKLTSKEFLNKCAQSPAYDAMMHLYECYKVYLIDHQKEEENEDTLYMKKCKSSILKFVISFTGCDEASNLIYANGRRIDFILSLLFENKSFDNGLGIMCNALQNRKIGLLMRHINSLIKSGFEHLEMNEWCELYCLLIDCISAALLSNKHNLIKKFVSSGSIAVFSRIPIEFATVENNDKRNVLKFVNKILQLFSSLSNNSHRMIKELSNPQWNFVPNLVAALRHVDISSETVDLLTHFATVGDILWITTGIELLFIAAEKDSMRDSILTMLVGYVDESSIANRYQCYEANALTYLLNFIEKTSCQKSFELFSLIGSTYFRMSELSLTLKLLSMSTEIFAIPLLKVLIKIAEVKHSDIPKSFFHLTSVNSFLIQSFIPPMNFTISTNVHFSSEFKKKTVFFTIETEKQKISFFVMDNKFLLEIHNGNKDNQFQLYTKFKPNSWIQFDLAFTPSTVTLSVNSKIEISSVIPSKLRILTPATFIIKDLKCDIEYIRIHSKEYSYFSYFNAKCVNDGKCVNTFIDSPIKEADFDGIAVPYTISFIDSIITCGGPRIFLPLFEKVCSEEFLLNLLTLINAIAIKNEYMFNECQFFRALADLLLNNINSDFITSEIIELIYTIYKSFTLENIKVDMLQHIFGNFSIWKKISKENQLMVYSGIFTSILQVDPVLFSDTLRFDELLLKFVLMFEDSNSTDELMQKSTNFLLMMSQSKFTIRDAQVLVASLLQNSSNEMCLNSIILAIGLISDNSKAMIDYLKEVSFFQPFIAILNSRFERTRIIAINCLYYLQSIHNFSEMSIEIIDSIRLFNNTNTTEITVFSLLNFMTKSIKYKDFPHISQEFDFENVKVIGFPQFLPLFVLVVHLVTSEDVRTKSLKYIRDSFTKFEESRKLVKSCSYWQMWLFYIINLESDSDSKRIWIDLIESVLSLMDSDIEQNVLHITYFCVLIGISFDDKVFSSLNENFKRNQTVECALMILKYIFFKRVSPQNDEIKDNEIHTFCQKILISPAPFIELNLVKDISNRCDLKALVPIVRFLIQQGINFLSNTVPFIEMNFTVVCFLIFQIGKTNKNDSTALLHLLLPFIEAINKQTEFSNGILILLNLYDNKSVDDEDERNELFTILKRIDPVFATMSNEDILTSINASKDSFISSFNETSDSISSELNKNMNEIHIQVSNELAKVFTDDQPILVKLRNNFSREMFQMTQDTERTLRKNHKFYKTIMKELSLQNGGPWFSIPLEPHYKFDNVLDGIGRRNVLVLNRKFNDHSDAAWELGENEDEKIGDEAGKDHKTVRRMSFIEKEQVESPNVYSIELECQMVTVLNNFKGTMYVSKTSVFFEAKETTDAFGEKIDKTSKLIEIPNKEIRFIMKRRYLCIDCAAEVFTIFNRSFFFNFSSEAQRLKFFKEIEKIRPCNLEFIQFGESIKIYNDLKLLKKWSRGEISNFEYLWWLNMLSGRTIHDISQYPVFPWVLKDYSSRSINLSDSKYFRDLSKPIGTLNEERLRNLRFLFDETKSTPFACLYRFHYSAPAYVILFMLRKEPFTSLHIQLQNDRFDHPNRLFYSINSAWQSVTSTQSDFRELIPEFYSTPEFLLNSDNYNLGNRYDFVQMAKSMSCGNVKDIIAKKQLEKRTKTAASENSGEFGDDETFTSLLNPESQTPKPNTNNENNNIPEFEANKTKDKNVQDENSNIITDDDLAAVAAAAVDDDNFEEVDPADFAGSGEEGSDGNDTHQVEEIPLSKSTEISTSNASFNIEKTSPSSRNFVGIKIIRTKKGQMIRRDFRVDDVELPPWAPSAAGFTAINRLALESSIASASINKWIDLIFGNKQRSEEADNVFHPFSYPQTAAKEEPEMIPTLQQHAANFGVCPSQLFTTLHQPRKFKPLRHILENIEEQLFLIATDLFDFKNENIIKISASNGSINFVFENASFKSFNFQDKTLVLTKSVPIEVPAQLTPERVFITNTNSVLLSPPWSQSFDYINLNGKKWAPFNAHSAVIETLSCDDNVIVTGAGDSSLFVWDSEKEEKISTIVAHTSPLTAVAISKELEIVVSCDERGTLVFSSMKTGSFIRKITLNLISTPKKILISNLGFVILLMECIEEDSRQTKVQLLDMGGRLLKEILFEGRSTSSIIMQNQDMSSFLVVAQETKLIYILRIYDLFTVSMGPVTGVVKGLAYSKDDLSLYILLENNELSVTKFEY